MKNRIIIFILFCFVDLISNASDLSSIKVSTIFYLNKIRAEGYSFDKLKQNKDQLIKDYNEVIEASKCDIIVEPSQKDLNELQALFSLLNVTEYEFNQMQLIAALIEQETNKNKRNFTNSREDNKKANTIKIVNKFKRQSEKQCNGLVGYILGEKLDPENAMFAGTKGAAYEGEVLNLKLYRVSFIKPFMNFTKCVIGITPNSHLIGAIFLYQEIKSNDKKTFDKVKAVIETHYEIGDINKKDSFKSMGEKMEYQFPNNRFMVLDYDVKLLGHNLLTLFVVDGVILKIAQEEFNQNTI